MPEAPGTGSGSKYEYGWNSRTSLQVRITGYVAAGSRAGYRMGGGAVARTVGDSEAVGCPPVSPPAAEVSPADCGLHAQSSTTIGNKAR
jgi:hypothetical protein